jgi:quinol monooxygenase YgiN
MAAFSYRSCRIVTTMVGMTAVFAILKARPEHVGQVQQQLLELKRLTRKEAGAVGYEVFRGDDGVFVVFEQYVDQSACDAHFAAPYVSAFLARVPELLTDEPQVQFATEVSDSDPS